MAQESSKNPIESFKCAKCTNPLHNPVQFSECLHILCAKCVTKEKGSSLKCCPQCDIKNAKPIPSMLYTPLETEGHYDSILRLGYDPNVEKSVSLKPQKRSIAVGWCEDPSLRNRYDVLKLLNTPPSSTDAFCEISHHKDCSGHPLPKNYFCCECLKAVCGDCSQKGEHKHHKMRDMENMKTDLESTVSSLKQKAENLSGELASELQNRREVGQYLRNEMDLTLKEIKRRNSKMLEETTDFCKKTEEKAQIIGKEVMKKNQEETDKTSEFLGFTRDISKALENMKVDKKLNTPQYVSLLDRTKKAELAIDQIKKDVADRPTPREYRLALCGEDMYNPHQQKVDPVRMECRQPRLLYSTKINTEMILVHGIVVKGTDQCFLSCTMTHERDKDAILHYQVENSQFKETDIYMERGLKFITLIASKDIVASYSGKNPNVLRYFSSDELLLKEEDSAGLHTEIKLSFEPRGIFATKENNILVCAGGSSDNTHQSFLKLLSLQGKVIAEAKQREGEKLSPKTVAESASGEICICDPEKCTLAIMDSKLQLKESFPLHTTLTEDMVSYLPGKLPTDPPITLRPEGVCYDNYGRIIVALADLHMVVRLSRSLDDRKYKMEPLIRRVAHPNLMHHFRFPKSVAVGEDGRLWVVCREYMFVFDCGI